MSYFDNQNEAKECLSICKKYCYRYYQKLEDEGEICIFILLNPKLSEDKSGCKTVKRCRDIAEEKKCKSMTIVNLCALITNSGGDLRQKRRDGKDVAGINSKKGKGKINRRHVEYALETPGALIFTGWGSQSYCKDDEEFNDMKIKMKIKVYRLPDHPSSNKFLDHLDLNKLEPS